MFRVKALVILALFTLILTACGGATTQDATPVAANLLDSPAQSASLDQVKAAINTVYSNHPDINTFVARSVTYTPETRDKVLKICAEGSIAANTQELESQQVMACAPLIFFFYNYGQQNAAPEATAVAKQLYSFAVTGKSADTAKSLTELLRGWGIQ